MGRRAVYMGQTENGKEIVHFRGLSHIYDLYLDTDQFVSRVAILSKITLVNDEVTLSPFDLPLIPLVKSYGFVNALILVLLSNKDFKNVLSRIRKL